MKKDRIKTALITAVCLACLGFPPMAGGDPQIEAAQESAAIVSSPVQEKEPFDEALRFNFNDVPLDTVLDYLSQAAGFVILREVQVEGRVSVVSHQPLAKDEAVELLNTVLNEKGFTAIRSDRTLTIVKSEDAGKRNIPVRTGNVPEAIPASGQMVTQIIPVRYADASQLLDNLAPLLPSYAVANANKSSNAIVLTDTQANVKRMTEIVRALDTSISAISEIKVFTLTYSKAADAAKLLNTLFQPPSSQQGANAASPMNQFFQRMRGGGGGNPPQEPSDSAAKQAISRVQAVADERTNSVVVTAPGELMPLIGEVIEQTDKFTMPSTEIRVFALQYADAEEMAQVVNDSFEQTGATSATSGAQPAPRMFGGTRGGQNGGGQTPQATVNDAVRAVADFRTNSVVVTAESTLMDQIAKVIERLDSNPAREQKVFIYKITNADPEQVANIMQGMFSQSRSASSARTAQEAARTTTGQSNAQSSRTRSTSNRSQ
ncbi:MAG TPA: secretin N-terminal domain-containing protein [Candidatus Hydrogenedentes bacterium]|nr:secretin N-terminal domain-containing protein [Candidatus Hydrogenedentota bacterium]HOS03668.1 secretin N-terminal domain-containing protein [Candidatus Hydrogenedentota bacterium]